MAAYLVALALIVFWPTPVDKPVAGSLHRIISWLHLHGIPNFIGYAQSEFTSNILLFVPMGVIAAARTKNAWLGLGIGFLASCIIEVSQALFLVARFSSALDVLANTLGAAVGAVIYFLVHRHPKIELVETIAAEPTKSQTASPSQTLVEHVETLK